MAQIALNKMVQHQLGQRQQTAPRLAHLSRYKLRKLAIEQSRDEQAYFRHDLRPEYEPLTPPKKGTCVIERIAPHRMGIYLGQVAGGRFDRVLVEWEGRSPEISSLYLLQLQTEQLSLF